MRNHVGNVDVWGRNLYVIEGKPVGHSCRVVGVKSPFHSSCERGCQEQILSPPLAGNQGVVTYIQPCLLIRGAFDFSALVRRGFQRRGQPQLLVPTHRFHETVALDAIQFRSYASYLLAQVAHHDPI